MTNDTVTLMSHDSLPMRGEPAALRLTAANSRKAIVPAMCAMSDALLIAATQIEQLKLHLAAMCGWSELLAEQQGWTRNTAASFYVSYDAARKVSK